MRTWLASLDCVEQWALDPEAAWQDPSCTLSLSSPDDPALTLSSLTPETPADPDWLALWRSADDAAGAAISHALGDELSEPLVAARLGNWLAAQATVFVASSMPVRDVELFWCAGELSPRVLSNRGANGIDGTVSSAFGAAAATSGPVVLLIGDVALAHDLGGLLAARRLGLSLTIVLLNNDGGGIFHFLPIAGEHDAFDQHIATPHGLEFAHAAALYGCGYQRAEDVEQLRAGIERSLRAQATTIIEVRTDRRDNLALHRRLTEAVSAALKTSPPSPSRTCGGGPLTKGSQGAITPPAAGAEPAA
jgi:2-succinyl-5-enolpyruvyl-6-hydroxy-3-cyclohexene-1-carboxylate synthase